MKCEFDWNPKDKEEVLKIRQDYRDCLARLGHSRDSHLFEMRGHRIYDAYYKDEERNSAWKFIEKLFSIEGKLDFLGRKILYYDCLEYGRHYRFWYLAYINKSSYERRRKRVLELVKRSIK